MTQSCLNFLVFLPTTLFLVAQYYGPVSALRVDPIYLECNESRKENAEKLTTCSIYSRILVEIEYKSLNWYPTIQFNCYNSTPMKFYLPLEKSFQTVAFEVKFNFCRFSESDNILEILNYSLRLSKIQRIVFDNELIDNSLSRSNLRGLANFVDHLSFTIRNISTLPTNLFADVENLESLSIYSNSSNSSHLSLLLSPLKNLREIEIETNNQHCISESIFANQIELGSLALKSNNIIALPSGIFSNLSKLYYIHLSANSFTSKYPEELCLETKYRKEFHLNENRVVLKGLPQGLLRDLPFLSTVEIINCQLESIPSDIFEGSKKLIKIIIRGNNLHELPFGLFVDQENLQWLDLSNNTIRTLIDELFSGMMKLWFLDLSNNQLTNLTNDIFKPLTNLKYLNLENNNLLTISSHNNQPHTGSVFDNLKYLELLKLKNNSINDIRYRIMFNSQILKNLDLSLNKISYMDCNFVTYFDSRINLTRNPIICDCGVICLHQHIIQKSMQYDLESSPIRCESPNALKGRLLYDLELSELLCNVSKRCTYHIRTSDSVLVMNCSGGNLNDIPMLPTFDQSFSNGIELFMDNNPLTELSSKILKENANISLLSIIGSQITKLPERFFSNLPKLRNVSVVLPLDEISEGMFDDSPAITTITISGTHITVLSKLQYAHDKNLIFLDLSKNRFQLIEEWLSPFETFLKLETLHLSHNFLVSLPWRTFCGLKNLKTLFLNNNCLQHMQSDIFENTPSLKFINMENNQLKTIEPFVKLLGTLRMLLIRNNSIGNDFFIGIQQLSKSVLDLSLKSICSMEISDLNSINVNETFLNFSNTNIRKIKVLNGNIPLNCDCRIISIIKDKKQMIMYESLRCLSRESLKEPKITNFALEELLCPMNSICPKDCVCWIRPVNSTLVVNCSNASLTEIPQLPPLETIFQNGIELSIDNNHLTSLNPHSQSGYNAVTKLFAAHNKITNIFREDIPQNMSYFDVSYNPIVRLNEQVIKVINESQTLRSVLLHHNPLLCDCSSENQTRFLLMNKTLFPDIDQCSDGKKFIKLFYAEICRGSNTLLVFCIVMMVILAALILLLIFYIRKKEQILIWMYAHKLCLCCVTEEEVDKDRKYDAFISYSSLDAHFIREIVSKLESGEKPYKLCLHDRDWLGGGFIPDQIEKSVQRSKRTVIVLTENYVKSKWTRLEFFTAHKASLTEKRIRVIVIIVGDVNIDNLDPDLQKYIKMYTYLRWEEPSFWRKLYYSLPHPTKKNEQSKMIRNGDADAGSEYSSDHNSLF